MHEIGASANNLLAIITDLLDPAQLDNGSVEIHISDVDGDAVVAEVFRFSIIVLALLAMFRSQLVGT